MEEQDIPILRRTYELYQTFHGMQGVVPKSARYTLWQRSENLILDVLEGIISASLLPRSEKLPELHRVSTKLNMLRVFLRLTKDTKVLDLGKCVRLQQIVDDIGRMLGGWQKFARGEHGSPSAAPRAGRSRE